MCEGVCVRVWGVCGVCECVRCMCVCGVCVVSEGVRCVHVCVCVWCVCV